MNTNIKSKAETKDEQLKCDCCGTAFPLKQLVESGMSDLEIDREIQYLTARRRGLLTKK